MQSTDGLKKWRPDYSKARAPPGAQPVSQRPSRRKIALGCFAFGVAILAVGALAGWFDQQDTPPLPLLPPPIPPPTPGPPYARVTLARPGVVTVTWEEVDGAVGYLLQEWNWNRLDDRGWYSVRALDGAEGDFMFRFGYGNIELPRCGTVVPVPHASMQVAGRAGLHMEWRVRSVGPTGALSGWSAASNAVDMPSWQGETVSNKCEQCAAGNHDHDQNEETLCKPCNVGTYAALGSVICTACPPGRADLDINPSTPCDLCPQGSFAKETSCVPCNPGYSDHDRDPATDCVPCPVGSHSPRNATSCTGCPAGLRDWDSNPSTVCTACLSCAPGECPAGTHMTRSADDTAPLCTPCRGELVDHDADPLTDCQICNPGTESSVTQFGNVGCSLCAAGKTDRDSNASTSCSACMPGRYSDVPGSVGNCSICAEGRSSDIGTATADACYHIGLAPSVMIVLMVLGAAFALAIGAILVVLVARALSSAKSGAQQWWTYRKTHRMKVYNYGMGKISSAVVPKASSWFQDVLVLMKRVDSTVHQASITEDVPQYPRPSASQFIPGTRACSTDADGSPTSSEANLLDTKKEDKVTRILTHWEAQYSGAVTGAAREAVALAVAAKRGKKPCTRQASSAVIKELRAEGVLSYSGYNPRLPKLSAAQHQQRIFRGALHASRASTDWRPTRSPTTSRKVVCDKQLLPYVARPRQQLAHSSYVECSNQLPPLAGTHRSRFSALEKAIVLEKLADLDRLDSHEPVRSSLTLADEVVEWLESIGLQHWRTRLTQLGTTLQDFIQLQQRDLEILGFEGMELQRFVSALNQLRLTADVDALNSLPSSP